MTEQQIQQLSRDVAAKYGIEPYITMSATLTGTILWLHNDSARCFELMVEHDVVISRIWQFDGVGAGVAGYPVDIREEFTDHNNDKPLATRIAILKALLAKEVE